MNYINALGQAVPCQINSLFVGKPACLPFVAPSPQTRVTNKNNTYNKGYKCTDELSLPTDFQPSAYSVVCGRGRRAFDAIGNRRLAVIASLFVERYANATKKEEKTLIVSEILNMMQSACPNRQHAFVRYSGGRWFRVQNLHAREKIGTVLRDSLHSKYKSSTKSKLALRKLKKNNASSSRQSSSNTTTKKTCAKKKKSEPIANFSELSEEELDGIFA